VQSLTRYPWLRQFARQVVPTLGRSESQAFAIVPDGRGGQGQQEGMRVGIVWGNGPVVSSKPMDACGCSQSLWMLDLFDASADDILGQASPLADRGDAGLAPGPRAPHCFIADGMYPFVWLP